MRNSSTVDRLGRGLKDLRISLTDKCNMRCRYCMPAEVFGPDYPFLKKEQQLDFHEIVRVARAASQLGIEKIRLTGGEPLMRRGVPELVKRLSRETDVRDIALTTNGLLLSRQADALRSAGLSRVNLSLDSLEPDSFRQMSGGHGQLEPVLEAVEICRRLEIPLKINTVLKKGVNDHQIVPMVKFGAERGIEVRFIEYMDVGCSNSWQRNEVFREQDVLARVQSEFGDTGLLPGPPTAVARRYRIASSDYVFGVIASITRPFCRGCVRARISSDGKLFTCLFSQSGHDLRDFMRSGASDRQLIDRLRQLWGVREDRYSEMRETLEKNAERVEMSYIGG